MKLRRKFFLSILFAVVMTALLTVSAFAKPALNKKKAKISTGQSVTLKVKGTKQKPKWTSSNKKIATVSKKGVVTGRSAGNVIIKAKVGGKTLKCKVTVKAPSAKQGKGTGAAPIMEEATRIVHFTFIQDGYYIARLEVQLLEKKTENLSWIYSDSCAIGQTAKLSIDTNLYEVNRVGYQIWFFGWDNDYMNVPYANTDNATTFILSGSGDYPEFTWS